MNVPQQLNAAELARFLGRHRSYMFRVLKGDRNLSNADAIKLFRGKGVRIGPVANLTPAEIDMMEHLEGRKSA